VQDVAALSAFFKPKSVAVVGASSDPKKPGNTALKNMLAMGYKGRVFPVNLREESVLGLPCYKGVLDIPEPLEMCVFLVSAELTLQVAKELAERKNRHQDVRAAVCMSAGFGELNTAEGKAREKQLVETLRSASIRLVGPNCLGVMDAESGFNTNFDIATYPKGSISILTQSGAFGNSFLNWAGAAGLAGLSKFVSIGNMADVNMAELLLYWKDDDSTRVIGIYMEGLADPAGFFEVAREVAAVKPIVVLKTGRSEVGSTAALSHTGAVAGADAIYEGAFKQAGIIRARTVSEFYDTLRTLAKQPIPRGNRVCVLTHMGGPGTICIDEISAQPALNMTAFAPETESALKSILAPAANVGRPPGYIDLTAAHYENLHNQVLKLLFDDKNIDMVLQILAPSAFLDEKLLGQEIAKAYHAQVGDKKPLLNVVTFGQTAKDLRRELEDSSLPTIEYPDMVARVAGNLASHAAYRSAAELRTRERQEILETTTPGKAAAAALITAATREGRISLLEPEAYEVCRQYNIKVPPFGLVDAPEDGKRVANEIGYPVVLKVVSSEILHKTDVGGVMLGINSDAMLEQSYGKLVANIQCVAPHIKRPKVLVQKMMPTTTELILGAIRDKAFGPAVMFGLGGIFVEAMKLVGFRLAPLGVSEAVELVHETLPAVIIRGARGRARMNVESIALSLVSLGRLLRDHPQIEQVDLNPTLPYEDGCMAVDARIILSR
jgi:acyl-CoA synthetase (NDP forming)